VLGLAPSELTGLHVTLGDLWGAAARRLREYLIDAPTIEILFQRLEMELLTRVSNRGLPHPAAAHALSVLAATPEAALIGRIQKDTGCSPKRFIALFSAAVGLTPKLFGRLARFQTVIREASRGLKVDWVHVALDCGYSDQPHLTREFREFAGVTPSAYRPVSEDRPHHIVAAH
jgi:AraC-like DNA-binding protein